MPWTKMSIAPSAREIAAGLPRNVPPGTATCQSVQVPLLPEQFAVHAFTYSWLLPPLKSAMRTKMWSRLGPHDVMAGADGIKPEGVEKVPHPVQAPLVKVLI